MMRCTPMNIRCTLTEFFKFSKNNLEFIHCSTEAQARKLLREFRDRGKTWSNGEKYSYEDVSWADNIVYSNQGGYTDIKMIFDKYNIYEFENVYLLTLKEFFNNPKLCGICCKTPLQKKRLIYAFYELKINGELPENIEKDDFFWTLTADDMREDIETVFYNRPFSSEDIPDYAYQTSMLQLARQYEFDEIDLRNK